MAFDHVRRDLLIFIILFLILTSSDIQRTSKIEPSVSTGDMCLFYAVENVSTTSFQSFRFNIKNRGECKMAPISRTKQLSTLLNLVKYGETKCLVIPAVMWRCFFKSRTYRYGFK